MKSQTILNHFMQTLFRTNLFLVAGTEFVVAEELTHSPIPNSLSITTWLLISLSLAIFGFMSKAKSGKEPITINKNKLL